MWIKKWVFDFKHAVLIVKVSNELWFDTLQTGTRVNHLFRLGYYMPVEYQNVKVITITLPFVSLKLAF